jgi:hypothetical protein
MAGPSAPVGPRYLDRFTETDRRLLAGAAGAERVRVDTLPGVLALDPVYEAVFGPLRGAEATGPPAPFVFASPFLVFAVAVSRTAADLGRVSYVPEWNGPRQRVPLFDGGTLLGFAADPWFGLFTVDLLSSFAHLASGSYVVRDRRGTWRRRRWSDLDPVRLAALLDVVPEPDRAGVYRRLGDLALFLTGVFPDHAALHLLHPVSAGRLLASAGVDRSRTGERAPIETWEWLGARWYRLAGAGVAAQTSDSRLLADVADRFRVARRLLNVVADRYLFPAGNPWFPQPHAA